MDEEEIMAQVTMWLVTFHNTVLYSQFQCLSLSPLWFNLKTKETKTSAH